MIFVFLGVDPDHWIDPAYRIHLGNFMVRPSKRRLSHECDKSSVEVGSSVDRGLRITAQRYQRTLLQAV